MSNRNWFGVGLSFALIALAALLAPVGAGPIDPPAGPVTSTSPSLSDLEDAITALGAAGAGADHASDPGSATDGRPLPLAGSPNVRLEIENMSPEMWQIADLGHRINVIEQQVMGPHGQVTIPVIGRAGIPEITLIRSASPSIEMYNFFRGIAEEGAGPRNGVLHVLNQNGQVILKFDLQNVFPSAYDVRVENGQAVEQVKLVMYTLVRTIP